MLIRSVLRGRPPWWSLWGSASCRRTPNRVRRDQLRARVRSGRGAEGSGVHCQGDQRSGTRPFCGCWWVRSEGPTPGLPSLVRAVARTLTRGRLRAGRAEGHVTIPIERWTSAAGRGGLHRGARSGSARRTVPRRTLGQVRFERSRQGEETWPALVPTVADRFGLAKPFVSEGRGAAHPGAPAGAGLVSARRGPGQGLGRRTASAGGFSAWPAPARWCALVALVNALVWAAITPAFQVPDEPRSDWGLFQHRGLETRPTTGARPSLGSPGLCRARAPAKSSSPRARNMLSKDYDQVLNGGATGTTY